MADHDLASMKPRQKYRGKSVVRAYDFSRRLASMKPRQKYRGKCWGSRAPGVSRKCFNEAAAKVPRKRALRRSASAAVTMLQ